MDQKAGWHFLQIPGPTNVPDRVLQAIELPTIDHRGPAFGELARGVLHKLKPVFQTENPVIIFPASGTGAWEAALVNTLSPGDRVLMCETGHFATLWHGMAKRLGIDPVFLQTNWRHGAVPEAIEEALREDARGEIKAVCVVHNETSTGVTSRIPEIRKAIDAAGHTALLMVDTISSLASIDYRHDEWGVDVTVAGSQKGLMLPPGLSFNAVSDKALAAAKSAELTRSYWDWEEMLKANQTGYFPYTPASNLLRGLDEALDMLLEEGLDQVFARHARLAEATRACVRHWGLAILCENPVEYSNSLTAVMVPDGFNADEIRAEILTRFNMSLGNGLGKLAGKVFRIGHLGDFNELMLAGTLSGVEMGLRLSGVPIETGGVTAAMDRMVAQTGGAKGSVAAA